MSKLKPDSQIGPFPYRIVMQLGADRGNMSDIYLATVGEPAEQRTASQVVLKISKAQDEHKEFFEDTISNEAEWLRKLDHRGVVRILPIQMQNRMRAQAYSARASSLPGQPWFLVLEHLTGDSLAALLENYKQLDVTLALEIVRKLAQTLEYLHYNDLVHLDLKPENILFRRPVEVGSRVEPVLIDFGIARTTGQAGLEGRTLHYAPPERILYNQGHAPPETLPRPTPSMDIYSLGVVFYQMLAGRRPFEGRTPRSISSAILEGKPTRPSKYSNLVWATLDDLVMQMLHRDPSQRPSAGELVERLAELRTEPVHPSLAAARADMGQIGARRQHRRLTRVRTVTAWLLGLLLVGIVGSTGINYAQTGQFQLPIVATLQAVLADISQYVANPAANPTPPTLTPITESGAAPTIPTPFSSDATATLETSSEPSTPDATFSAMALATVQTATPTRTPASPTAKTPTSTPVPTNTTLATPSPSFTPKPTTTKTPTATPSPADIPTPKPPPSVRRAVTLLQPMHTEGNGRETFAWQSNFALAPGQAYELIIWREGQDPMVSGLGWAGVTNTASIDTDLLRQGAVPEAYLWGVLLVEVEPYKRIEFLGESRPYVLKEQ